MPWVRFTADFPYKPRRGVVILYRSNTIVLVKQDCAAKAIAIAAAVEAARPERPQCKPVISATKSPSIDE